MSSSNAAIAAVQADLNPARESLARAEGHLAQLSSQPDPARRLTLTLDKVGQLLGISRSTVGRLVRAGTLSTISIGSRVLVGRAEVDRLLGQGDAA